MMAPAPPAHPPRDAGPGSARPYRYRLVDVFTEQRFHGNPLAVFTDARGLDAQLMQRIARELAHPETTFVFPPLEREHDFSVRIFSPHAELPTAAHPSIGTAFALAHERTLAAAPKDRLVFDESSGPISVSMVSPITTIKQELPRFGTRYPEPHTAAAVLSLGMEDLLGGVPVQAVGSSLPYLLIPVAGLDVLRRIRLRLDIWERTIRRFEAPHVFAFCLQSASSTATATARMFAPALGISEAPASETACGPLAAYLIHYRLVAPRPEHLFVFEQGAEIGRPSRIHVNARESDGALRELRVGGQCVLVGEGTIYV
ncbi:MAG TPA: PhzF family phenazine biosynthesis protein [Polyangiaceae bacterium]|nr:PhzF family phenazine biosynthesis protein [Polyangiaceae bacterium]